MVGGQKPEGGTLISHKGTKGTKKTLSYFNRVGGRRTKPQRTEPQKTEESRRSEGEKIRGPDAKGRKSKEAGLKPWPTCPFLEPTL